MKLNKYFMLGLAGLAFAACSNDDEVGKNLSDDNTPKTLIVSIAGIGNNAVTKANAPGWSEENGTTDKGVDNIKSLALFFTDGAGVVKYGYQVSSDDTDDKATVWSALTDATKGVKFVALEGVDAVHVAANVTMSDDELKAMISKNVSTLNATFKAQSVVDAKTSVIYAGSDLNIMESISTIDNTAPTVDLVGTEDKPATSATITYTAEVKLYPVLSRIQINKITMKTAGSINFPSTAVGGIAANTYKLEWSGFKPTLHGIYLNNFADKANYFSAAVEDMRKNTTALNTIKDGQWLFGTGTTIDYADATNGGGRGAYVNYNASSGETNKYGTLLAYPTASNDDNQDLTIDDATTTDVTECIAFNILVPFNFVTGEPVEVSNPSIHFQFTAPVEKTATTTDGYEIKYSKVAGGAMTDADNNNISHCTEYVSYTMPGNGVGGYLYANISKLLDASTNGKEISLAPGKIYNMEVAIDPANMIVDIVPPTAYNVVVKITVENFTDVDIFPGLDEN